LILLPPPADHLPAHHSHSYQIHQTSSKVPIDVLLNFPHHGKNLTWLRIQTPTPEIIEEILQSPPPVQHHVTYYRRFGFCNLQGSKLKVQTRFAGFHIPVSFPVVSISSLKPLQLECRISTTC
jgi:hypothetical protein